jgi:hypothetical protein
MDRRRHVRHEVQLPVELDWGAGVTQDMSVSGAYIEAPPFELPVGETFNFSVTIGKAETGCWTLRCQGMVIRIEKRGEKIGIAASIDRFVEINSSMSGLETSH